MTRRLLLAAALLVAAAAPLPFAPAQAAEPSPHVSDAPDDARESDSTYTAGIATETYCRAAGPGGSAGCAAARDAAGGAPSAGGNPAPASMEALAATFSETPEHLVVRLEVAGLDEAFTGAVAADGTAGALYTVCWTTSPDACTERAVLAAMPGPQGPVLTAFFAVYAISCNDYGFCTWRVPHEIETGAPGAITWRIPRAVLPNGSAGVTLQTPELTIQRYVAPQGRATWPSQDGYGYGIVAPPVNATGEPASASNWGYTGNHVVVVDAAGDGTPFALATTAAAPDIDARFDVLEDLAGDVIDTTTRPDLDVLALRISETDINFTISVQVARVDATPADHQMYGAFGLPSGRYYTFGYRADDGTRLPYADVCAVPGCHEMAQPDIRTLPVSFAFTPGEPGWINATFDRSVIGEPRRGDLINHVDVTMYTYDETTTRDTTDTQPLPARAILLASGATDTLAIAPPWWFHENTRRLIDASGFSLQDAVGDVDLASNPLVGAEGPRYDITYLEAGGLTSTSSRVTIGIQDLSRLKAPQGSGGFVYAVGLRLEGGVSTMVGFYYAASPSPTTPSDQDFFCSEDTAVYATQPRDPATAIWRTIDGIISAVSTKDASGAGQRGSITFVVPHECFGIVEPGPVSFESARAVTLLLPPAQNDELEDAEETGLRILDDASYDEPFTLQATEVVAPGAAWYVSPFGIEGFWDITGIASAIIASMLGALALRRRRRRLERWLRTVDQTVSTNANQPRELEKALQTLRTQLREDLLQDKLEHAHFTIIDKRIEEARGKARVHHLAEAFEDLPHRLLRRLEELLSDGSMTREDYRVFSAMLDETPLHDAARASIRRKLLGWVREDEDPADADSDGGDVSVKRRTFKPA